MVDIEDGIPGTGWGIARRGAIAQAINQLQ